MIHHNIYDRFDYTSALARELQSRLHLSREMVWTEKSVFMRFNWLATRLMHWKISLHFDTHLLKENLPSSSVFDDIEMVKKFMAINSGKCSNSKTKALRKEAEKMHFFLSELSLAWQILWFCNIFGIQLGNSALHAMETLLTRFHYALSKLAWLQVPTWVCIPQWRTALRTSSLYQNNLSNNCIIDFLLQLKLNLFWISRHCSKIYSLGFYGFVDFFRDRLK